MSSGADWQFRAEKRDMSEQAKESEERKELSQAETDYQKGKEFLEENDQGQAAAFFHNALKGFEQDNDERGVARASDQLGDVCMLREEYDAALSHFTRACTICEKFNDPYSVLAVKKKMLAPLQACRRFAEAVELSLDLLDMYRANNNPAGTVELLEMLADVYVKMGKKESAADAYRTAASIHANFKHKRQSLELEEKARAIEEGQ
jgi:tetratricopeptide (TPR) repeat protein